MRKISLFLVGVFLLLLSGNLFAQGVGEVGHEFTFTNEGVTLHYKILSLNPNEVETIYHEDHESISADISVPMIVEDENGNEYTVVGLGMETFYGCQSEMVFFSKTVRYIGQFCFSYSKLRYVAWSDTVDYRFTSLGDEAFGNCTDLEYVYLPNTLEEIGADCFFNATVSGKVVFTGTTPPTITSYHDGDISIPSYGNTNFYVPYESADDYRAAEHWSVRASYIKGALIGDDSYDGNVLINDDMYLDGEYFVFPSTITIKDGASLSASSPSSLSTKLSGKTVRVEKDLAIDEFSLIGNIGGATNYGFIASNIGDNSGFAHSMVALPFYYAGNSWGVDADGNGAINGTHTPVSYGESFFVYPTTNKYNTNGTTIDGDTYTTLTQSISSSKLKLSNFTISLTNGNTTRWFALSNPFIGKLNLSKFYTSNSSALQSTYAYVWDNTEHDWVALDGINTTNKYALYPATGILIEGASANANATFNFNVADIVTTETITTTKTAQANRVEFTATSNDVEMKMYAHIDENSDNGYGRMDASVLFSNKEDAVNPYFALEGRNIFDNYFSELPATFDVNFNAYKSNTIDFAVTSSIEGVEVTLIDLANENAETVLNVNEPVTINVTAGQNEGRYQLRFSKKNVGINEVASEENTIQIWNNNSEVSINGKDLKKVEIYNTLGQRVYSSSLVGESTTFDSNLNAGAYIVKVYTANSSKSEKIIIR